MENYWLW